MSYVATGYTDRTYQILACPSTSSLVVPHSLLFGSDINLRAIAFCEIQKGRSCRTLLKQRQRQVAIVWRQKERLTLQDSEVCWEYGIEVGFMLVCRS
jgi:hypothetical protein